MARFVRVLAGLFVLAQFAGALPSSLASGETFADAVAMHIHPQHMHHHTSGMDRHADRNGDRPDRCCALHAFFAGVLPTLIAIKTSDVIGQRLAASVIDILPSAEPSQLDRPPRPFVLI